MDWGRTNGSLFRDLNRGLYATQTESMIADAYQTATCELLD